MLWSEFGWFALPAIACWVAVAGAVWLPRERFPRARQVVGVVMVAGMIVSAAFIAALWIAEGRPPLRTMGETRLWYSLFIAAVDFGAWRRYRYRWLVTFGGAMATVFTVINLLRPEGHSAGLAPALQSGWFVPHVVVYMLAYAMVAAGAVGASIELCKGLGDGRMLAFVDETMRAGTVLIILGMCGGMVWAEAAWGRCWAWDPKETWALATLLACLLYIHLRRGGGKGRLVLWMVVAAFVLLGITWIGVNYLPSAAGSVHVY